MIINSGSDFTQSVLNYSTVPVFNVCKIQNIPLFDNVPNHRNTIVYDAVSNEWKNGNMPAELNFDNMDSLIVRDLPTGVSSSTATGCTIIGFNAGTTGVTGAYNSFYGYKAASLNSDISETISIGGPSFNSVQKSILIGSNFIQKNLNFNSTIHVFAGVPSISSTGKIGNNNIYIVSKIVIRDILTSEYLINIGYDNGFSKPSTKCILIGDKSTNSSSSSSNSADAIVIGYNSYSNKDSISIGTNSSTPHTGIGNISIGNRPLRVVIYESFHISIGKNAGYEQGYSAIAIGYESAKYFLDVADPFYGQKSYAIAIGPSSGYKFQGTASIAIGNQAGYTDQANNSIVISAIGLLDNTIANSCRIAPLRENPVFGSGTGTVMYETTTKEMYVNTAKTFVIRHPLDEDKYLVHACLEGPEAGVYYRGKGEIKPMENSTEISLPNYVDKLATDFTVQLTAVYVDGDDRIRNLRSSQVINGKFKVYDNVDGPFMWLVHGMRSSITTEPLKQDVSVYGNGPYKYIR